MSFTRMVALAAALMMVGGAVAAQTQVGAMATITLSDPDRSAPPWQIQRQLLRTWTTEQSCENQKMSFINFHLGQVEGIGLVTPSGKSPKISVESVECFTIRD